MKKINFKNYTATVLAALMLANAFGVGAAHVPYEEKLLPVQDTYADSALPQNDLSTATEMKVSTSANFKRRAYMMFDISGIEGVVTEAILNLHARKADKNAVGTSEISVYSATSDWTDSEVRYENEPTEGVALGGSDVNPVKVESTENVPVSVDITEYLEELVNKGETKGTVLFKGNSIVAYVSSKETATARRPYITIKAIKPEIQLLSADFIGENGALESVEPGNVEVITKIRVNDSGEYTKQLVFALYRDGMLEKVLSNEEVALKSGENTITTEFSVEECEDGTEQSIEIFLLSDTDTAFSSEIPSVVFADSGAIIEKTTRLYEATQEELTFEEISITEPDKNAVIIVKGKNEKLSGGEILLSVFSEKKGMSEANAICRIRLDDKGEFEETVKLNKYNSGKLKVVIGSKTAEKAYESELFLLSDGELDRFAGLVNDAEKAEDIIDLIINNETYEVDIRVFTALKLERDRFIQLSEPQQRSVANQAFSQKEKNAFTRDTVGEYINEKIIYGELNASTTVEGLVEKINEYDTVFGLERGEGSMFAALDDVGRDDTMSMLLSALPFEDGEKTQKERMNEEFNMAVAIALINRTQWTGMEEAISQTATILGIDIEGDYDRLSKKQLEYVHKQMVGNGFEDVEAVRDWFDAAVADAPEDKKPSSSGGGGGGGGSSYYKPTTTPVEAPEKEQTPDIDVKEEAGTSAFDDMAGTQWAEEAVNALYEKGVISGMGDNKFAPDMHVTREQFALMAVRAFGLEETDTESDFLDVPPESWSYKAVSTLYSLGLVFGIDDESFGAKGEITREDMAVIIHRIMKYKNIDFSPEEGIEFADKADISDYAKEAVEALSAMKIINGAQGNFAPGEYATRAMAAQVLYNALV